MAGGDPAMSAQSIPTFATVDVCVIGGCLGGVAAALAAAEAGASVLILAERTYLGEDAAGRLELLPGGEAEHPLARQLWQEAGPTTPLRLKARLGAAVRAAGVAVLVAASPTQVLRDAHGGCVGVVVTTCGGPLAVQARVLLDATAGRLVADLLGTPARIPASLLIHGVGDLPAGAEAVAELTVGGRWTEPRRTRLWRLVGAGPGGGAIAERARAEADLRIAAFTPGLLRLGDAAWEEKADDPAAWLSDACALAPLAGTPVDRIAGGWELGREAARRAGLITAAPPCEAYAAGADECSRVRLLPSAARFAILPRFTVPGLDRFRLLGSWQVGVLGGGTGGAPAGLAAARDGASVVVAEAAPGLGGVGTQGMIGSYWDGNRVGATTLIDQGVDDMGPSELRPRVGWNVEWKAAWYLRELRRAGAEVWLGTRGAGCSLAGERIDGLVLTTPWGCGLAACGAVVDSSGSAAVPAAAGAQVTGIGAEHVAVQGTGLGPRELGVNNRNSDWTFVDDADPVDVTRVFAAAERKWEGEFDVQQIIDTRERRQIRAEHDLDLLDILGGRTYADTVSTASSSFDTHGFTIHPAFMILPPPPKGTRFNAHIPLRSLLPRGLDGVLVTGLGMGAHRDALPVLRMQADVQNTGWSAGLIASRAARFHGGSVRQVGVRGLQAELIRLGALDAAVAGHQDVALGDGASLAAAIAAGLPDHRAVATVLAQPQLARPLLATALDHGDPAAAERIAQALGLLGGAEAAPALIRLIDGSPWDEGWEYRGMHQFGRSFSRLDGLIVALGRCGAAAGVPVLRAAMARLDAPGAFSHLRALGLAAACLGDTALVGPLSELLARSGMTGHHHAGLAAAVESVDRELNANSDRNLALRELAVARALWLLGDHDGQARAILQAYAHDPRGIFARHAQAVLDEGAGAALRWDSTRRLAAA